MVVLTIFKFALFLAIAGIIITQVIYPVLTNKPLFNMFKQTKHPPGMSKRDIKQIVDDAKSQLDDINSKLESHLKDTISQEKELTDKIKTTKQELNKIKK